MACGRKGNCICLHLLEFTGNAEGCEGLEGGRRGLEREGGECLEVWGGVRFWSGGGIMGEKRVKGGYGSIRANWVERW